ncbi:amidohydrolase 2 [Lentithecium fluviatile CBS 122367]|uniref:6-methylsalicylate decarboxylase n=1 Tax=Lentithecium fluviatile CBS 122367 TaxID=1168545 RepID=A0A6G1J3G2_9PLEO|nr:amidohydrolase 2 [Lentithecium fluviatile CBS 122367]
MTNPLPPRIDIHSHFLPPFYHDALVQTGHSHPDGMPTIPPWSIEAHLKMMESANVQKSILSISSPGTHLTPGDDLARKALTRQCNAYVADLKKQYPEKFGLWASLPLPDVDASLEEIERAVEEGCDGFGLMTNYHGRYIGDAAFDAVFERLNELGATVFIHPTTPCIAHGTGANATVTNALPFGAEYPVPIFEFLFDTARAVIKLFYSGTINRSPKMRFIIPHVGGTLPPLVTRFTAFGALVPGVKPLEATVVRKQIEEQFYFDLAGLVFDDANGRGQLKAFIEGFDISYRRLLYGSDFPFTNNAAVVMLAGLMKGSLEQLFGDEEREAIYEENAVRLLQQGQIKARF